MEHVTLVVEFADGKGPEVHAGMKILGGMLAAVGWYDALDKLDKLEEQIRQDANIDDEDSPLPDEEPSGVTPTDFKYAKMQTLHQLLVNTVTRQTGTTEGAVELARLVDAAYEAIDSQQEAVETSPADDINQNTTDFSAALMRLKQGRYIARNIWPAARYVKMYVRKKDTHAGQTSEVVVAFEDGHSSGYWQPTTDDLIANDWRVVS